MKFPTIMSSVEQQVSSCIKLNVWDHASYEFQEDHQGKMIFDYMTCLYHGI